MKRALPLLAALLVTAGCGVSVPSFASTAPAPGVTVEKVTDGDTFHAGGQTIRVLVVDSCEMKTPGGTRARAQAVQLLAGQRVTLVREPGVDVDRYGRALRYVTLPDGRDYGEVMVAGDHTAVYAKKSDASPARMERARLLDRNGRNCERP